MTEINLRQRELATWGFALGLFLMGSAFLAPNTGPLASQPFYEIARQSCWQQIGDWPAAWCSLKWIALSLGILMMALSLAMLLAAVGRSLAAAVLLVLALPSSLTLWMGLYLFVKAVL